MLSALEIHFVVEGDTDAAVARRLITLGGANPGMERVTRGKAKFASDYLSTMRRQSTILGWQSATWIMTRRVLPFW